MLLRKLKLALLGVLTAGLVFAGAAVSTQALTPEQATKAEERSPPAAPREAPQPPPAVRAEEKPVTAKESRVQSLRKERLKILRDRADKARLLHQQGAAAADVVREADLRVFRAELDLCETDRERVAVQEKIVGIYKTIEDRARQLEQSGASAPEVLQEAIIKRLEAEIELERFREKVNPPSK